MEKSVSTLWLLGTLCILSLNHAFAQDETTLRFLTEHNPPAEFLNEKGRASGVTVELIHILQQRLNEPGEIKILPWGRAMKIARAETGIALFETVRTKERENWFKWVGPLQSYHISLYGLKRRMQNKPSITTASDQYVACSYRNSAINKEIEKLGFTPGKNFILTSKVGDCLQMVLLGRADVTPISEMMFGKFKIQAQHAEEELIAVTVLTERQRYLAFSLDVDDKRIARWQNALEQSYLDGTMRSLYQEVYPETIIQRLEQVAQHKLN
ncbi:substrate-binding periplasmic protein [Neptunicella sp.]|uniref:substrate-binding periplasmic protein n=1 Tax=Neptunicella sp. TaxID=2125986 RepID=UPI003F68F62B